MIKWLAAFLGYSFLRFPGAILGFFIGSFIELLSKGSIKITSLNGSIKPEKFELNLLALSALIIKADGKIQEKEFITQYGKEKADSIFKTFNAQIKQETQHLDQLAQVFVQKTQYETRLQILHFLFGIANADGSISSSELYKLAQIAAALKLRQPDVDSIKAMFIKNADNAYKILEVQPTATVDEVKSAYRKMVKKYHPDKLRSSDPAMVKGAEEKFRAVRKAYEIIMEKRK